MKWLFYCRILLCKNTLSNFFNAYTASRSMILVWCCFEALGSAWLLRMHCWVLLLFLKPFLQFWGKSCWVSQTIMLSLAWASRLDWTEFPLPDMLSSVMHVVGHGYNSYFQKETIHCLAKVLWRFMNEKHRMKARYKCLIFLNPTIPFCISFWYFRMVSDQVKIIRENKQRWKHAKFLLDYWRAISKAFWYYCSKIQLCCFIEFLID